MEKQERRTVNEIVDEIIKGELIEPSLRQEALTSIANVKMLADRGGPLWGNKKENLECATALRKQIEKLQKTLEKMPGHMLLLFFAPDEDAEAVVMATNAEKNTFAFVESLRELHSRCKQLEAAKPGIDGNIDHLQRQVAVAAKVLMQQSDKRIGSSSPKSPFRVLAGLLYEAVTGVAGKDMERACDYVARVPVRTR